MPKLRAGLQPERRFLGSFNEMRSLKLRSCAGLRPEAFLETRTYLSKAEVMSGAAARSQKHVCQRQCKARLEIAPSLWTGMQAETWLETSTFLSNLKITRVFVLQFLQFILQCWVRGLDDARISYIVIRFAFLPLLDAQSKLGVWFRWTLSQFCQCKEGCRTRARNAQMLRFTREVWAKLVKITQSSI